MRKTFEINDIEVLGHLDKQDNQTKYIISLIKKDMKNKKDIDREMIIKIIQEYLGTQDMAIKHDNEVKNSAKNILNMLK